MMSCAGSPKVTTAEPRRLHDHPGDGAGVGAAGGLDRERPGAARGDVGRPHRAGRANVGEIDQALRERPGSGDGGGRAREVTLPVRGEMAVLSYPPAWVTGGPITR